MWRSVSLAKLVSRFSSLGPIRAQTVLHTQTVLHIHNQSTVPNTDEEIFSGFPSRPPIGENVTREEKVNFLLDILDSLDDSKESVYHALDAWVAWEKSFPFFLLRKALIDLKNEYKWHRIIHVIKWMLSKGHGTTMGTYGLLIRALDMDHRAEEAHEFWLKRLGVGLHKVPWQLTHLMIAVYHTNNMMERVVMLFKGLEAFDRKPRHKSTVKKVCDACEILGLIEEKERVLEEYKSLFNESSSLEKATRTMKKKSKSQLRSEGRSETPVIILGLG